MVTWPACIYITSDETSGIKCKWVLLANNICAKGILVDDSKDWKQKKRLSLYIFYYNIRRFAEHFRFPQAINKIILILIMKIAIYDRYILSSDFRE